MRQEQANGPRISRRRAERSEAKPVGWMRWLASAPRSAPLWRGAHACSTQWLRATPNTPTFSKRALSYRSPLARLSTCLWFVYLLARCRVASHALLSRRSYTECHTAQVVSRDVGFRPAVPLPAVAIFLRALLNGAPVCISPGLNGLRLFGNHCLSIAERAGERTAFFPCICAPAMLFSRVRGAG